MTQEKKTNKKLCCEVCNQEFSESELDLYDGKLLCSECEQEIWS